VTTLRSFPRFASEPLKNVGKMPLGEASRILSPLACAVRWELKPTTRFFWARDVRHASGKPAADFGRRHLESAVEGHAAFSLSEYDWHTQTMEGRSTRLLRTAVLRAVRVDQPRTREPRGRWEQGLNAASYLLAGLQT